MQLFCPSCSNLLIVTKTSTGCDEKDVGKNRLECRTCPFEFVLNKRYFDRKDLKRKEAEDIVSGGSAWENCSKTEVQCVNDKCESREAFFHTVQIRSADEPMTIFYKCIECAREWRE
ncbi:hypothetical protein BT63DRAFT_414420 [Microthyrium microscopicum]|uniref:DNA-directed RNA polymerase subunit n=1 Tax=Microthyrium microscopicum TaxID=703497 RepID=A0A6A6U9Y4_9PEZI|nr:hypothetical protein BT63DRAFT_414420 [Microthyrium microscopicum]